MGHFVSCLCGDEEEIVQISSEDPVPYNVQPGLCDDPDAPLLSRLSVVSSIGSTEAKIIGISSETSKTHHLKEKTCIQIERKITHYSSSQKILLVGEGDFSFSACLALVFASASNMVATSLDSKKFLFANYKKAQSNIDKLRSRGCKVIHEVDATEMANNDKLNDQTYDRIIYNFPLAGFFKGASKKTQLKKNRKLILMFLENAKQLISESGEVHITHKSNGFFLEWNLQQLASQSGFRLLEEAPFNLDDYNGYNTKFGFGGDDNFDCNPSKTYKFGLKRPKQ